MATIIEKLQKRYEDMYVAVGGHRKTCKKWGKELCLDCFGGGLNRFRKGLFGDKYQKAEWDKRFFKKPCPHDYIREIGSKNIQVGCFKCGAELKKNKKTGKYEVKI